MKNQTKKQEAIVVATKYKNKPINIDYYTKNGEPIQKDNITIKHGKAGMKFFYFD